LLDRAVQRLGAEIIRFRVTVTSVAMFVMATMVLAKQHRLHQELKAVESGTP
jgi:hypothetical protein